MYVMLVQALNRINLALRLVLGDETFGHTQSGYIVCLYIIRQARSLIRVLSLREICIE